MIHLLHYSLLFIFTLGWKKYSHMKIITLGDNIRVLTYIMCVELGYSGFTLIVEHQDSFYHREKHLKTLEDTNKYFVLNSAHQPSVMGLTLF